MAAERNMSAMLEQALTPSVLLDRFPKVGDNSTDVR
jgi:hypothetical protein